MYVEERIIVLCDYSIDFSSNLVVFSDIAPMVIAWFQNCPKEKFIRFWSVRSFTNQVQFQSITYYYVWKWDCWRRYLSSKQKNSKMRNHWAISNDQWWLVYDNHTFINLFQCWGWQTTRTHDFKVHHDEIYNTEVNFWLKYVIDYTWVSQSC